MNNGKQDTNSNELSLLNDEEIDQILHQNNIFPDEIILPPNDTPTTTTESIQRQKDTDEINDIINPSIIDIPRDVQDRSLTLARDASNIYHPATTDLIRRPTTPLQNSFQRPLPADQLYSSRILEQNSNYEMSNLTSSTQQRRYHPHKSRPAFVNKLWSMLNDNSNLDLIQWSNDGKSFVVTNREQFVHEILPKYFKHSNFASFVRQLNMYGWHKVQDVKSGSIQNSSDEKWQFENEYFQRDREDLLEKIVRQKSNSNNTTSKEKIMNTKPILHLMNEPSTGLDNTIDINGGSTTTDHVSKVLNELEAIKYNQLAISKDLLRINKDNELLWKENMMARERYRSQQQTLEKIFRFLASIMPQKMIMDGVMNNSDNTNSSIDLNSLRNKGNSDNNNSESMNTNINEKNLFDELVNNEGNNNNSNNNNYDTLNRASSPLRPQPRYLLKNRSNKGQSMTTTPTSAATSSSPNKILELNDDDNMHPIVEEYDTNENETNRGNASDDSLEFLNNLQSNISEQDNRIQHLEDIIIQEFSPKNNVMHANASNNNGNSNTADFSLHDYFNSDAIPNSPIGESDEGSKYKRYIEEISDDESRHLHDDATTTTTSTANIKKPRRS
ncbi:hypothetical protein KAFR_0C02250 [Kazachstania africana CBS 2517]|uniref:Heat shock transcription factor n=1 Tax=Kazachstania africana (strain ATCC 22294 / BCRC 22015 / CBS 2517 / CECT 1963 / NBRC 1671 / NRRL Y-8276) TaxID=1071382 RepID=H2AS68_KAZAF|nr:hypothetical protein KAFR_0C02250 [Kazachstania africana CBS 2517]CCF57218.1 hypothetical protein KAFR_0C02250 [Kazachstania africana CBS 2517]